MSEFIQELLNKIVNVITNDGRNYIGTLISYDQTMNIILTDCTERIFESEDTAVHAEKVGLNYIRGDNVAIIGEIDLDLEENIDYSLVKACPIPPMDIF